MREEKATGLNPIISFSSTKSMASQRKGWSAIKVYIPVVSKICYFIDKKCINYSKYSHQDSWNQVEHFDKSVHFRRQRKKRMKKEMQPQSLGIRLTLIRQPRKFVQKYGWSYLKSASCGPRPSSTCMALLK